MIGNSLPMWKVKSYMRKVALTDSHVPITGETGSGKELAAQYIHQQSARRGKPLIAINCAALPDGLLESELFGYERGAFTGAVSSYPGKLKLADGGTVLFDEIGDMSLYAQAKILRVIETKEVYPLGARRSVPVDIRIMAATNRDLERQMSRSEFRKDLYFRLNVALIHLGTTSGAEGRYSTFDRSLSTEIHRAIRTRTWRGSARRRWISYYATNGRVTFVS